MLYPEAKPGSFETEFAPKTKFADAPSGLIDDFLELSPDTSPKWDDYSDEDNIHKMDLVLPVSSPIYDTYGDEVKLVSCYSWREWIIKFVMIQFALIQGNKNFNFQLCPPWWVLLQI